MSQPELCKISHQSERTKYPIRIVGGFYRD